MRVTIVIGALIFLHCCIDQLKAMTIYESQVIGPSLSARDMGGFAFDGKTLLINTRDRYRYRDESIRVFRADGRSHFVEAPVLPGTYWDVGRTDFEIRFVVFAEVLI